MLRRVQGTDAREEMKQANKRLKLESERLRSKLRRLQERHAIRQAKRKSRREQQRAHKPESSQGTRSNEVIPFDPDVPRALSNDTKLGMNSATLYAMLRCIVHVGVRLNFPEFRTKPSEVTREMLMTLAKDIRGPDGRAFEVWAKDHFETPFAKMTWGELTVAIHDVMVRKGYEMPSFLDELGRSGAQEGDCGDATPETSPRLIWGTRPVPVMRDVCGVPQAVVAPVPYPTTPIPLPPPSDSAPYDENMRAGAEEAKSFLISLMESAPVGFRGMFGTSLDFLDRMIAACDAKKTKAT